MYSTYIIFSQSSGKYYTGQCENIESRLQQHNTGRNRSTIHGAPWKLIFSQAFDTRSEAVNLETKIKSRGAKRYLEDNNLAVG